MNPFRGGEERGRSAHGGAEGPGKMEWPTASLNSVRRSEKAKVLEKA